MTEYAVYSPDNLSCHVLAGDKRIQGLSYNKLISVLPGGDAKVCQLVERPCHCLYEGFYAHILFLNSRVFVYMMFIMQLFSWFHMSFWICVAVAALWFI